MNHKSRHPASFRDPSGFVFSSGGKYYRQVNKIYAADFELFKSSGLFDLLVKQKKLLAHTELDANLTGTQEWYSTLLPAQLDFIAYPYEWSFTQWKEAALLTLELVETGIQHGMILKDATPFNIQFIKGAPVFIDTLSFEKYDASSPWIAYRQFVACFMGPLLLAKYCSPDMLKIFQLYPDGMPISLIAKLLPRKAMFNPTVFLHIKLPGMLGNAPGNGQKKQAPFTRQKLLNIVSNLHTYIERLYLPAARTQWNNYYDETILSNEYAAAKLLIIEKWLKEIPGQTVLDIGTNTGRFAIAAAATGKFTIATDADSACIDKLYNDCRRQAVTNVLPLCVDITHPSPAIGWDNAERTSFTERAKADITMALAMVHHLAIGKNVALHQIASSLSRCSPWLIVEFVPKSDPKVQLLLKDRSDIFSDYTEAGFLEAFGQHFAVLQRVVVGGTERVLFLMKSENP